MNGNSGKLLIVAILSVALVAAVFSWTFRLRATRQSAHFWGPAAARMIRDATSVEGLVLDTGDGSAATHASDMLTIDRTDFRIASRVDLSHAPGLTHLRHALLEDRSFKWEEPPAGRRPWKYVLVFRMPRSANPVRVLLTDDCASVALLRGTGQLSQRVSVAPISDGLTSVFSEWLARTD